MNEPAKTAVETPVQTVVWRAFSDSVIVRAIERPAAAVKNAAAQSVLLSAWQRWFARLRARAGVVLCAAAFTNIALASGRHPAGRLWLTIPGIAGAIGIVLVALDRRPRP